VKIKSGFIVSGLGVASDEPNNKYEKNIFFDNL